LDVATGLSLFIFADVNIISIEFLPNSAFVACLSYYYTTTFLDKHKQVKRWNALTHCVDKSIEVDKDVFHVAPSPDGSKFVSLSSSHIKLIWKAMDALPI
jgi:hypothetical protein